MGVIKLDRFMQPTIAPAKTTLSDTSYELEHFFGELVWPLIFIASCIAGALIFLQTVNTVLLSMVIFTLYAK